MDISYRFILGICVCVYIYIDSLGVPFLHWLYLLWPSLEGASGSRSDRL